MTKLLAVLLSRRMLVRLALCAVFALTVATIHPALAGATRKMTCAEAKQAMRIKGGRCVRLGPHKIRIVGFKWRCEVSVFHSWPVATLKAYGIKCWWNV